VRTCASAGCFSNTTVAVTAAVDGLFAAGMVGFWLRGWPTRRQSQVTVTIGVLCIASWSLAQTMPGVALLACTAGAITGGYIAFFHGAKKLVFNFVVCLSVAAVAAVRVARQSDMVTAASAFFVVALLNIGVPLGIRGLAHTMSRYAAYSYEDPLTGLLNRRGFTRQVTRQLKESPDPGAHLNVLMVDLDNFKRVNDTYGHATGDSVLIAVAELLCRHAPPTAAICRSGGEEFLVAVISRADDLSDMATSLCDAIAALSHSITASIGTTRAEEAWALDHVPDEFIDRVVGAADIAMYSAKRNGGNQACVR
jgi:diguanylate cyclase